MDDFERGPDAASSSFEQYAEAARIAHEEGLGVNAGHDLDLRNRDVDAVAPGPWDSWLGREHDAINVERATLLAQGRDELPPSMLRAMGLA